MNPGKYLATAIGGGMGTTKTGKLQIGINFKIKDSEETIWWYGGFDGATPEKKDKAIEITTKTLAIVGFNEDQEPQQTFGREQFTHNNEVELDIQQNQPYQNEAGEMVGGKGVRVAWVNMPGGGSRLASADPAQLKTLVKGANLRAFMAKARKDLNIKPVEKKEIKNFAPGSDGAPF